MSALGLIETIGLVAAIEGLDAALKAADVETIGCEFVGSGIVTVKIRGEIGAVKASMDAAEAAVNRVGTLRATHVIARTSDEIIGIIETNSFTKEDKVELEVVEETKNEVESLKDEIIDNNNENLDVEIIEDVKKANEDYSNIEDELNEEIELINEEIRKNYTQEELQAMKVSELRTVARTLKTKLTRKKIKFAKKDELIEAILEVVER